LVTLTEVPPATAANLTVALLAFPLFALLGQTVIEVGPARELVVQWGTVAVVVGVAVGVEEQPLSGVGFRRPTWTDLGYAVAAALGALAVFAGTDSVVEGVGLPVAEYSGGIADGVGIGLALAGAVTTGVTEEVLFRGYSVERLLAHTDSPLVASGLTWAVFTIAHAVVWPVGDLLQVASVAAVFTAVYLRRRTLVPVMVAHVSVLSLGVMGQYYG
jgi:membrane protease YdiL (CAAX protease family)